MLENQLVCYQNAWIINEVYKYSTKISNAITNTAIVENRILQKVGKYINEDVSRLENRRYILRMIQKEVYDALKRNRKEHAIHFADISYEDDSGELIEYDPADSLAIVDTELLTKETVALLAKNDGRRNMILNAWANGNTNDTEISDTLASVLGGQSRSHCKFIQRFRTECRSALTAAI
jgi:hypothetical protein